MLPRRRANNDRAKLKEMEEFMDQKLQDLGLLELGMSFRDKEELLNIIRLSENTAQAEEDGRKTKESNEPSPVSAVSEVHEDAIENELEEDKIESVDPDIEVTQDFFPSDVVMKYKGPLEKKDEDQLMISNTEEPKPLSEEDQISGSASSRAGSVENCGPASCLEIEINKEASSSSNAKPNMDEIVIDESSLSSAISDLQPAATAAEISNEKPDINVFSYKQEPYLRTFCRSKVRRAEERIPFYLVSHGMDIHKYTAFFKCYVNEYMKRLHLRKKRCLEHLEWGPPICMQDPSVSDFREQTVGEENDSCRRYNFRNRLEKPKVIDFTSENSGDEESNDEDIFKPRSRKLPGLKLTSKRKISSTNDVVVSKKEKKDTVLDSKKVQDPAVSPISVKSEVQSQEMDLADTNEVSNNGVFTKKVPRSRFVLTSRKRNRRQGKEDTDVVGNSDISSTTELDTPASRDEEVMKPFEQLDDDNVLKPVALSAKQKRVLMSYTKNSKTRGKKTEMENTNVEVSKSVDSEDVSAEPESKVPCPICGILFPGNDIEEHASDCNQYHPDTSTNSTE